MKEWIVTPGLSDFFVSFIQASIASICEDKDSLVRDRPLLIIGDSGVGKSMFIEAYKQIYIMHHPEHKSKIVRINCAALSENLVDSELFGHVKGAYTGAIGNRKGILEESDVGLVILDEIGELSEYVQAKLLILIEDGEFRKVGSNTTIQSKVKIIGTTNKSRDFFRDDFWFRFHPLFVPPLYERRMDILVLIYFMSKRFFHSLTPAYALRLLAYNWPGNVRELERVVVSMDNGNSFATDILVGVHGQQKYDTAQDLAVNNFPTDLDKRFTEFHLDNHLALGNYLSKHGVDVYNINKVLVKFGLKIKYDFSLVFDKPYIDHFIEYKENIDDGSRQNSENLNNKQDAQIEEKTAEVSSNDIKIATPREVVDSSKTVSKINASRRTETAAIMGGIFYKDDLFYHADKMGKFVGKEVMPGLSNFYIVKKLKFYSVITKGLSLFCNIFFQDSKAHYPLLSMTKFHCDPYLMDQDDIFYIIKKMHKKRLVIPILEALLNQKINYRGEIDKLLGWNAVIHDLILSNKEAFDTMLTYNCQDKDHYAKESESKKSSLRIFKETEKGLLTEYYTYLMDSSKNIVIAAKRAGVDYETFRSKLRKYKIKKRIDFFEG